MKLKVLKQFTGSPLGYDSQVYNEGEVIENLKPDVFQCFLETGCVVAINDDEKKTNKAVESAKNEYSLATLKDRAKLGSLKEVKAMLADAGLETKDLKGDSIIEPALFEAVLKEAEEKIAEKEAVN